MVIIKTVAGATVEWSAFYKKNGQSILGPQFKNLTLKLCFLVVLPWRRASENVDPKMDQHFFKRFWSLCLLL